MEIGDGYVVPAEYAAAHKAEVLGSIPGHVQIDGFWTPTQQGVETAERAFRDLIRSAAKDPSVLFPDLADASVLLGIYFDSGGSTQNAGSLTTYDADRPFSAANLQLANLVQADVLHAMNAEGWQIPDAGVVPDSDVGSLVPSSATTGIAAQAATYGHVVLLGPALAGFLTTPSTMPGALIEPLFITDPFEGSLAASAHGQEVIARGLARAVEQYLPSPTSHPKGS